MTSIQLVRAADVGVRFILTVAAMLLSLGALMIFGPSAEIALFPVSINWRVDRVAHEGDNLILSGTVVRNRKHCKYLAPPGARDGADNLGLISMSQGPTDTWAFSTVPQRWGPWVIVGGAGRRLEFFIHHRCHAAWMLTTELGQYDDRKRDD